MSNNLNYEHLTCCLWPNVAAAGHIYRVFPKIFVLNKKRTHYNYEFS